MEQLSVSTGSNTRDVMTVWTSIPGHRILVLIPSHSYTTGNFENTAGINTHMAYFILRTLCS